MGDVDSARRLRTDVARAARVSMSDGAICTHAGCNHADCHSMRAAHASRISDAREVVAAVLDSVLSRRWEAGDETASNRCLAERFIGIEEKGVRKMRDGRLAAPWALDLVLPRAIAADVRNGIREKRVARMSMPELVAEVATLNAEIARRATR